MRITGEAIMATTCALAAGFGAWLEPRPAAGAPHPPVIEVIADHARRDWPAAARAGVVVIRLVNVAPVAERVELVQLDRWRSLGDPFRLAPGSVTHRTVELVPGDYALLRVESGAPNPAPGLIRRVHVR